MRLRFEYREFTAVIELMPKLLEMLGLKTVPHYTTLQKFFKRLGSHFLDKILDFIVGLFDIKEPWVAIDGTGHSSDQASLYYARKIKKQHKKWRKSYTKNQIAIDTRTQVILAQKVARRPRHDSKDAIPTIRKTKKYKPSGFSLDKAFDKEEIHRVINEELEATSMIPPKKRIKKANTD
ncbi:MAG: Transposase IS4 family protein [Methanobacteriaceae archaeon 41_258]|nr:MAG: Transposase IS4 family protein [Methanobacteriaceae archaeon 41_258]